jgi:hypothetical protein
MEAPFVKQLQMIADGITCLTFELSCEKTVGNLNKFDFCCLHQEEPRGQFKHRWFLPKSIQWCIGSRNASIRLFVIVLRTLNGFSAFFLADQVERDECPYSLTLSGTHDGTIGGNRSSR